MKPVWWENRGFLVAVALLCAVPLIYPEIPPLVDVPGHIGRYRVELDLQSSPDLQRYFAFKWSLVANLGVDLLIIPIAPLVGLEAAVKVIVLTIQILFAAGIFWTAREVHGRVPPTALFAIPFIYGYPFNYGFINFALSLALALLALPLWLNLGRHDRPGLRGILFVPLSCLIWLVHAFGWGALGLTIWSAELVRHHDAHRNWLRSAIGATRLSIVLALPVLLILIWRSGAVGGETHGFFALNYKTYSLLAALRDRWLVWDTFGVAVAAILIGSAIFDRHLALSRKLGIPAIVLGVVFLILPSQIFGSGFADMRLAPFALIIAILAVRFRSPAEEAAERAVERRLAILGVLFIALRLGGNTLSFALADREDQRWLQALDHIPRGAPVLSLVGDNCGEVWELPRHSHLGSLVIARNFGFSNDQWQVPGAQLLRIRYLPAAGFQSDPSEMVNTEECLKKIAPKLRKGDFLGRTTQQALDQFPRAAFDFVWMIRPPDWNYRAPPDLVLVWRNSDSILYRVVHAPRQGSLGIPATAR